MSNPNAAPGPNEQRLRTPRVLMALGAVAVLGGLGYYALRDAAVKPAPVDAQKNLAARFESIQGNVKTRGVGGLDWNTAVISSALKKSDLVRTYPSSSAEIKFFDETRVTVRPDSLITIEETSRDPVSTSSRVAWKVASGEINYETRRSTGSAEAVTPTLRLALDGNSAGTLRIGDNGQTAVAQLAGAANLRTKSGEDIRLTANEGIRVDASGKAGLKEALPSTPTPVRPGDDKGVLSLADGESVSLSWSGTAGAASYRLQVETVSDSEKEIVFDKDNIKTTKFAPGNIIKGAFTFRVAAMTPSGVQGRFSEPMRFTVVRTTTTAPRPGIATTPPRLVIEVFEARSNVVRLQGKTEPGARLTVNGETVVVQPDGTFREFITLARKQGEQRVVIRATSPAGGIAEETRTVTSGQ